MLRLIGVVERASRILRMVQPVEEIRADFKPGALANREDLRNVEIDVIDRRSGQNIAPRIGINSRQRPDEVSARSINQVANRGAVGILKGRNVAAGTRSAVQVDNVRSPAVSPFRLASDALCGVASSPVS